MIARPSLRHRLTMFYTTAGSIAFSTAGIAAVFLIFLFLTRADALSLAQTARDVENLAATAPATESTASIQQRIMRTEAHSGVDFVPISAQALRDAPAKQPPMPLSVASIFGIDVHFVRIRDAALVLIPERAAIESFLRMFIGLVIAVIVVAVVVARIGAGYATRQALAPLLTVTAELERFAGGDFTPRTISVRDPTELGDLASAYNRASQHVIEAFLERGRAEEQFRMFVAEAGHELRTPLTIVSGYIDVLRRGGNDVTIRQRAFATLAVELKRMRTLVERLMILARLDGPVESQSEAVDVGLIVEQAVNALRVTSGDVPIDVHGIVDVIVRGQPGDLYEVVANLLDNALKYGARTPVSVIFDRVGEDVRIAVSDGGPGIPAQHHALIFDRFYRVAGDTPVAGSGLGLAIAAKAAQRLKGRLVLSDARAGSTTFLLLLPADGGRQQLENGDALVSASANNAPRPGPRFDLLKQDARVS